MCAYTYVGQLRNQVVHVQPICTVRLEITLTKYGYCRKHWKQTKSGTGRQAHITKLRNQPTKSLGETGSRKHQQWHSE